MKRLICYTTVLLLCLMSTAYAQNIAAKPQAFNSFPARVNCAVDELSKVFATSLTNTVNLNFSDNFSFRGTIISSVNRYNNLQTVVIKSSTLDDMVFVVSKITEKDGVSYIGHMICKKYADGFELRKNDQNIYQLIKIETDKVLQDCSQH